MKLARKEPRPRLARATEVLGSVEVAPSPMADFEQLFTAQERQRLERKFLEALEELEGGKPDKREFIEAALSGLLVLDQALTTPLVAPDLRQRARAICEKAIQEYASQLTEAVAVEPLNANLTQRLSVTRQVFPEMGERTKLPTTVVEEILQRLVGPERPGEWHEARTLFDVLILNPEHQAAIKKVAWAHGLDEIWKSDRVAQDKLLPKALHRLLEPSTQLTPTARQKWIGNRQEINQDPDIGEILSLSILGNASLAILLAPDPRVMPDGRIDLGMPKKKLVEVPGLPVRPQV